MSAECFEVTKSFQGTFQWLIKLAKSKLCLSHKICVIQVLLDIKVVVLVGVVWCIVG